MRRRPCSTRGVSTLLTVLFLTHLFGLVGCANPSWDQSWPEPRSLGRDIAAVRASRQPDILSRSYATLENPAGELHLRDVLALALERNPELEAFSWEVRAREARTLQAGLRPNPEIGLEVENFAGSGATRSFDSSETTLALAQLIETAGKRAKRRRVAELEEKLAGWDYEARRIEVFARVTQGFVSVLAAQEQLALSGELLGVAEEAQRTVKTRVREGAASPVERSRAIVAVSAARVERDQRRAELDIARAELAELWGSSAPSFSVVIGNLFVSPEPPTLDALVATLDQSPVLARWTQSVGHRRALVELADAQRIPNVTLAAGYRHLAASDDNTVVAGVIVPIPLFDQNQGERSATRFDLSRTRAERRAVDTRVRTALRTAHRDLVAARERVERLRKDTLPEAERAYRQTLDAYRQGLFRYLDVLDAQRTLFEIRANFIAALRTYHTDVAEIEGLTGEPVASPAQPGSKNSHALRAQRELPSAPDPSTAGRP